MRPKIGKTAFWPKRHLRARGPSSSSRAGEKKILSEGAASRIFFAHFGHSYDHLLGMRLGARQCEKYQAIIHPRPSESDYDIGTEQTKQAHQAEQHADASQKLMHAKVCLHDASHVIFESHEGKQVVIVCDVARDVQKRYVDAHARVHRQHENEILEGVGEGVRNFVIDPVRHDVCQHGLANNEGD